MADLQTFELKQNDDYLAFKGSYEGQNINIRILDSSVFAGAKLQVYTGSLYNGEFDFVDGVTLDPVEITTPTVFDFISIDHENQPVYGILKVTNAVINTNIKIILSIRTTDNIKSFIQ